MKYFLRKCECKMDFRFGGSPFSYSNHPEGIPQLARRANFSLRQQNITFPQGNASLSRQGKHHRELRKFLFATPFPGCALSVSKRGVIARRAQPDVVTEGNACGAIPEGFRKLWGIATPVCALVRNDVFFFAAQ